MNGWDGFLPMFGRVLLVLWILAGGGAALFSLLPRRRRRRPEPALPGKAGSPDLARELESAPRSPLRREGLIRRFRTLARDLVSLDRGVDEESAISIVREGVWIDDREARAFVEEDPFTAATLGRGGRLDPGFLERAARVLALLEAYRRGIKELGDGNRGDRGGPGEHGAHSAHGEG